MLKKILIGTVVTTAMILAGAVSVLADGDIRVKVNGNQLYFDSQPRIENDRTIVPIRFIAEALQFNVDWNEASQGITISKNGTTIKMTVDSSKAYVNDKEYTLDMPPVIRDNRTLVPVRFITENLNCTVDWFGEKNIVGIHSIREDGRPASIVTRLIDAEEYELHERTFDIPEGVIGDRYKRWLTKDGANFLIVESELGSKNNFDASFMFSKVDEPTRYEAYKAMSYIFPKDYTMMAMYLCVSIRREANEGFGDDYILGMVRSYTAGRNMEFSTSLNKYDEAVVAIQFPGKEFLPHYDSFNDTKAIIPPLFSQNGVVKDMIEEYNIKEYTYKDYEALKLPLYKAYLDKYYFNRDDTYLVLKSAYRKEVIQ